ncbi:hypothetical protein CAPTEDRAFT_191504 [Capitella teleta]|uniref:VWFD domain-containing protein n=1 Tax=Capitella teleta TaxID=283909 RepID=R7UAL8_CAPTE|nr:hypothetical protein CAPTEDRAFT_191504 [Capitella teleta]|eukprot:ELU00186.1 hypothetical protein CAPTEDRAFT_191504 [Capitella teleta]
METSDWRVKRQDYAELGTCTCFGDPHCYRFDDDKTKRGHQLHINSTCAYTLVTDSCAEPYPLPGFTVTAVFTRPPKKASRTFVKELIITNHNFAGMAFETYELMQGLRVKRNAANVDLTAIPDYPRSTLSVVDSSTQSPNNWKVQGELVQVEFTNGYKVLWDGVKQFKIIAPEEPTFNICGLCGNNDGFRPDTKAGPHVAGTNGCPGKQVELDSLQEELDEKDVQSLVNSWYFETAIQDDFCLEECT